MAALHLNTKNLERVLDALVTRPRWAVAMKAACGASEQLAFKWAAASRYAAKDDDTSSIFYLEWRGAFDFWHLHAGRARRESLLVYEAIMRDQAMHGIEEPMLDAHGRQIWKEDPKMIGFDDEQCDIMFGHHDRLLREDGNAIPLMRTTQVPATTRNKILDQIGGYREAPPQTHIHNNLQMSPPLKALRRAPARPAEPLSLPPPETEMVRDLRERLKAAIANPNRDSAKQTGPVEIMGRVKDTPDQVSRFPQDVPPPPRVAVPKPAAPNYARKLSTGGIDQAGMGRGPDPSLIGKSRGFKLS